MKLRLVSLVTVVAALLASQDALAQITAYDHMLPARTIGMAGNGRSFASGANALFLNPAALGSVHQYIFGAGYGYAGAGDGAHVLSAEWIDSTPIIFILAMGFAFDYVPYSGNDAAGIKLDDSYNAHLSMSYTAKMQSTELHVGFGGHRLINIQGSEADIWTGDAGLVLNIGNQFMAGFAGYNLYRDGDAEFPRGIGGGVSYWSGPFMVGFDVSANFDVMFAPVPGEEAKEETQVRYIGALQYMPVHDIFVRGGANYDAMVENTRIAAGVTIIAASNVGLEFGYQHNLDDSSDMVVVVNLQLYNPFPGGAM